VSGVSASMTGDGKLTISSVSVDQEIAFANDTSGVLAALGVNTFFTGYDALSLGVADHLREDPGKFAASRGGVGVDTENAVDLADCLDRPLEAQDGASLGDLYHRLTADAIQSSAVSHAAAEGARVFEDTLRGEKLSISGVSLDEEAIRMISFQAAFQASAKYIGTLNELLETLVNL
jgi:flagellar hook-associated protein 1 FlgK